MSDDMTTVEACRVVLTIPPDASPDDVLACLIRLANTAPIGRRTTEGILWSAVGRLAGRVAELERQVAEGRT